MSNTLNDLSKQHQLISNLFKIPKAKSGMGAIQIVEGTAGYV